MCRDCEYGDYKYIANEPKHPYEILDESLNKLCRDSIKAGYRDWVKETAMEYFNTSDWDDCWWDSWEDCIRDIV